MNSSTLCHMTTINNIIYITQTLLGLSLKQLLFEYKIRTLTIKFHLIWSNNRPIIQIKPTHPNKILKKGHETCYSLIFGNTAEIRSVGQSSVKVLSPKKRKKKVDVFGVFVRGVISVLVRNIVQKFPCPKTFYEVPALFFFLLNIKFPHLTLSSTHHFPFPSIFFFFF